MANTFAPYGFRSFGHRDGTTPTMGLERRFIISSDASVIGTGDPTYNSTTLLGYVTLPTTGTAAGMAGIFAGCEYYSAAVGRMVWSSYFPGNIGANATVGPVIAYLISDPDMMFLVQGSTNAVLGTSVVGWNIGYSSTSAGQPNTTNGGQSTACLLSSSVSANSSMPFRIVDVYSNYAPPGVNGTDNTVAGAVMVVTPNNWDRRSLTGVTT